MISDKNFDDFREIQTKSLMISDQKFDDFLETLMISAKTLMISAKTLMISKTLMIAPKSSRVQKKEKFDDSSNFSFRWNLLFCT